MKENIETRINHLVATIIHCPVSEIQPEKHLYYDLLADSLMITDIILALEVEFSLQTNDADLAQINTVGDLYNMITSQCLMVEK